MIFFDIQVNVFVVFFPVANLRLVLYVCENVVKGDPWPADGGARVMGFGHSSCLGPGAGDGSSFMPMRSLLTL